jgi:uncharacterized protein (TIGR04255 family)
MDDAKYPQGNAFEVACEMRFGGTEVPVGAVLPGLLYSQLNDELDQIALTPAAAIPENVRRAEENLRYLATHRLFKNGGLSVLVGDQSLVVSNIRPYRGWASLLAAARRVFGAAIDTKLLGPIERVSVRYVNLFESPMGSDQLSLINAEIRIGNTVVTKESLNMKLEYGQNGVQTVVALQTQANVKSELPWGGNGDGLVFQSDILVQRVHNSITDVLESLELAHGRANDLYAELTRER